MADSLHVTPVPNQPDKVLFQLEWKLDKQSGLKILMLCMEAQIAELEAAKTKPIESLP
jgi:hypothetical protein